MEVELFKWESFFIQQNLDPPVIKQLEFRLDRLLKRLSISERKKRSIRSQLIKQLTESHRSYHNLSHIWNLYQVFFSIRPLLEDPIAFQWAIWLHDAVYDPKSKTNESDSLEQFQSWFSGVLSDKTFQLCSDMIISTAGHHPRRKEKDIQYFLDADLCILAAPEGLYYQYTEAIRTEFSVFPDSLYLPGRKKVLSQFSERSPLFYSTTFQNAFESQAKENLRSEANWLAKLV